MASGGKRHMTASELREQELNSEPERTRSQQSSQGSVGKDIRPTSGYGIKEIIPIGKIPPPLSNDLS